MMSYVVRNSVVLGLFILLVGGGGFSYIYFFQVKQIKKFEKESRETREKLGDVSNLNERLDQAQKRFDGLSMLWKRRPKIMPASEEAGATNAYLNSIIALCPQLDVNVFTHETVKLDKCGYVHYHLAGQGPFPSLLRMFKYIELGPRLIKITNPDIREVHTLDSKTGFISHTVQFDADILAYYSDQPAMADSSGVVPIEQTIVRLNRTNPFYSIINPEIPPNVDELPDAEKSTLLAVMKDRAFINDQKNELVMLVEGDEVYLGFVSKIMPERKQVQFMLNKGGLMERYVLTLKFETKFEEPKK
jgi:hypothetical protein